VIPKCKVLYVEGRKRLFLNTDRVIITSSEIKEAMFCEDCILLPQFNHLSELHNITEGSIKDKDLKNARKMPY
jgi:hypothetical protein